MEKFLFLILFLHVGLLQAYDPYTHRAISREALSRSAIMTDPDLLLSLGLDPGIRKNSFPNSLSENKNIFQLIQDGVEFEDSPGDLGYGLAEFRVKHHFYDPQNDGRGFGHASELLRGVRANHRIV